MQELAQELESVKSATTNGPTDQPDLANEEELTHLREEKLELADTVKELEGKLNDLKTKNNVSTSLVVPGLTLSVCEH